jgi:lipoprotein-anchoring transpeptidase ErfK/SrfK
MKHILPASLAALLLTACSHDDALYSSSTPVQPLQPVQPIVPVQLPNPLNLPNKELPTYVNTYPAGTHEHFAASKEYPLTLEHWADDTLLKQVTRANSKLVICIPQQRARLYVNGRVAMDWAVSTGTNGHETPTGVFRVIEKNEDHKSSRYGKFIDAEGKVTNSNADLAHGLPEGQTFEGAGMPNWHRFTPDGVGLHTGKVVAGKRLSHGCIRTQHHVATKFFQHSVMGLPVYITRAVEDYYRGGFVKPIDVKYRPKPGNDYSDDIKPEQIKIVPADSPEAHFQA